MTKHIGDTGHTESSNGGSISTKSQVSRVSTTTYISWQRPAETKHLDSGAEADSGCPLRFVFCVFRDFCFGFSLCVAKAGFSYAQRAICNVAWPGVCNVARAASGWAASAAAPAGMHVARDVFYLSYYCPFALN